MTVQPTTQPNAEPDGQLSPEPERPSGSRVDWATVPRVNLLPTEISDSRRFRVARRWFGLAVVLTLGLAGAGVYWAQQQVSQAEDALSATQSRTTQLEQQQQRYAAVPQALARLAAAKAARAEGLGQDVLWYRFLDQVALATPANVSLSTMNVTLTSVGSATGSKSATSSATADPLVPTGIGTVTVVGTAPSYPDVAAWLQSIAAVPGLDASTLQNAIRQTSGSGSSDSIKFTTTVVITSAALSHRYDQKAG